MKDININLFVKHFNIISL